MKKYVNKKVDLPDLDKLKREMDDENSPEKYGKYKAWLHYANLKSWQEQGWHWAYLNNAGKEMHCTCGLVIEIGAKSDLNKKVLKKLVDVELDHVQTMSGHRKLPDLTGTTCALMINFHPVFEENLYLWDVICQRCGSIKLKTSELVAKDFINFHNKRCKSWLRRIGFSK